MIKITTIRDKHLEMLQEFCNTCAELGYQNNSSFLAMKLLWCKQLGEYWCAIEDNKIIAVAGCHPLPEVNPSAWRIMFRGCELPKNDSFKGLGKGDWNSITQREFIPLMIKWIPSQELYITTNIRNDHSNGKALRNHRLMGLLAKQGILDDCGNMLLNNHDQTLWKLNINEYTIRRNKLTGKYVST
jgi:hypothetical protein